MTNAKDFIKSQIEIMQAFIDGKELQFKARKYGIHSFKDYLYGGKEALPAFYDRDYEWRIKPELVVKWLVQHPTKGFGVFSTYDVQQLGIGGPYPTIKVTYQDGKIVGAEFIDGVGK